MSKLLIALKSKRVLTIIVLVAINGFASVHDMIPANLVDPITWALGALGVYFGVPKK